MTSFQEVCVSIIEKHGTGRGGCSISEIAFRMKSNRLAVSSALRSLQKQGIADNYRYPRDSQWASQIWFLKK